MKMGMIIMNGFSASKRVLNLLEPIKLTIWKDVMKRIAVVKFKMDISVHIVSCEMRCQFQQAEDGYSQIHQKP